MQLQSPTPGRSTGSLQAGTPSPQGRMSGADSVIDSAHPWERSRWHQTEAPDTAPPPLGEVLQRFRAHQRRHDGACSDFGPGTVEPQTSSPRLAAGDARPGSGFSGTHPMGLPPTPDAALSAPVQVQFREAWQGLQVRELDSLALFNHFFGGWPR